MDAARCVIREKDAVRNGHAESSRHAGCVPQHTGPFLPTACRPPPVSVAPDHAMRTRQTAPMISASLRPLAVYAALLLALPDPLAGLGWVWPVERVQVVRAYEAPAHAYGLGHRGIDVASGEVVRSPADGHVAFAGEVAGRPVVTIDHGGGLVTTLEPVVSDVAVGDAVARAAPVGRLAAGGHTAPGTLHFGVRLDGEYINPLRLLGGVPRAVLLPCC